MILQLKMGRSQDLNFHFILVCKQVSVHAPGQKGNPFLLVSAVGFSLKNKDKGFGFFSPTSFKCCRLSELIMLELGCLVTT